MFSIWIEAQRAAFTSPTGKGFTGVRDMRYNYGPTGTLYNDTPSFYNRAAGIIAGGLGAAFTRTREKTGAGPITIPSELFPEDDLIEENKDDVVYTAVFPYTADVEKLEDLIENFKKVVFFRFKPEFDNKELDYENIKFKEKEVFDSSGSKKLRLIATIPKQVGHHVNVDTGGRSLSKIKWPQDRSVGDSDQEV